MEVKTGPAITPPRLIGSFITGFNTAASHAWLVLFPLALDLLVWFAPHLSLKNLLQPIFSDVFELARRMSAPEMSDLFNTDQQAIQGLLAQINLVDTARTIPVGLPSLFAGQGLSANPLGPVQILEMPSLESAFLAWLILVILGTMAGCMYFSSLSAVCSGQKVRLDLSLLAWQTLQSGALALLLAALIFISSFPIGFLTVFLGMISPGLIPLLSLGIMVLISWFIVPLVFSAHGIFSNRMNVLLSISTSVRLVRFFLPGTGLMLVFSLLGVVGFNLLWRVPPADSWLGLVGLAGHAFISTGLLAASFVYYQGGMRTMNAVLERIAADQVKA